MLSCLSCLMLPLHLFALMQTNLLVFLTVTHLLGSGSVKKLIFFHRILASGPSEQKNSLSHSYDL